MTTQCGYAWTDHNERIPKRLYCNAIATKFYTTRSLPPHGNYAADIYTWCVARCKDHDPYIELLTGGAIAAFITITENEFIVHELMQS